MDELTAAQISHLQAGASNIEGTGRPMKNLNSKPIDFDDSLMTSAGGTYQNNNG